MGEMGGYSARYILVEAHALFPDLFCAGLDIGVEFLQYADKEVGKPGLSTWSVSSFAWHCGSVDGDFTLVVTKSPSNPMGPSYSPDTRKLLQASTYHVCSWLYLPHVYPVYGLLGDGAAFFPPMAGLLPP